MLRSAALPARRSCTCAFAGRSPRAAQSTCDRQPAAGRIAMSFQEIIARRPVGASLVAIGIILLGALAGGQLPIALLPTADAPTITVSASLPGASPKTIAATVAAPLQRQPGRIAGVTELTSYSIYGRTPITAQFELGRNINHAPNDVQ